MSLVDIVMPVHNRWDLTEQSLRSLMNNTDKKDYRLYIMNDGSDQYTHENLINMVDHMEDLGVMVKLYHHKEPQSPGVSRNEICKDITQKYGRGSYLYHSDNDVYFTEDWLYWLIKAYEFAKDKGFLLIGGGCHPYLQSSEFYDFDSIAVGNKDAVSGYSQLMTWETWDKYGPFDETMRNAERKIMGSEDWAFCQKIVKDGFKVGSLMPEVVIHCGKTNTYGDPATGNETFKNIPGIIIK